jgi:polyisoprenoid-binding protein YceI
MKKKTIRIILLILFILAVIGAAGVWYFIFYRPTNFRRDPANEKGVVVTAASIAAEFVANEDSAGKKYNDKAVEVSGEVERYDTAGGFLVILKTGIPDVAVSARLKAYQPAAIGSTVSVKGILTGYILGEVQLNEASITSTSGAVNTPQQQPQPAPVANTVATPAAAVPAKDTSKALAPVAKTYKSSKGKLHFFSKTSAEDIEATNTQIISTINSGNGQLSFAGLIKGFRFENELMQEHFNQPDYMNSEKFPKAEFKGIIANFNKVNLSANGKYPVTANGTLSIHGVTKSIVATGTLTVNNGSITVNSVFNINPKDYGISSSDIAESIKITAEAQYN